MFRFFFGFLSSIVCLCVCFVECAWLCDVDREAAAVVFFLFSFHIPQSKCRLYVMIDMERGMTITHSTLVRVPFFSAVCVRNQSWSKTNKTKQKTVCHNLFMAL